MAGNKRLPQDKNRIRICLIGASHLVDDDRMLYREGLSLAVHYNVEVVGAGVSKATVVKDGVTIRSYRKRRRLRHIELLTELFMYLRSTRFDVVHCFDLDTLAIVVIAVRFLSKRSMIVYDAHEHFPSLIAEYFRLPNLLSAALESFLDKIERHLASFCDAFVTVNETLRERFSVYSKPIAIVRNVSSLAWYDMHTGEVLEETSEPIVIFSGNLGWTKGVDTMIEAKRILDNWAVKTCFVVTGRVKGGFRRGLTPENGFRYTGWLDYDVLPCFLRKAKIGLALARPSSTNRIIAQPSKLFAYMAAGLPIVATELAGAGEIVRRENCGVLVEHDDAVGIASAIANLLRHEEARRRMGQNARHAAERVYNWEAESQKLFSFYNSLKLSSVEVAS